MRVSWNQINTSKRVSAFSGKHFLMWYFSAQNCQTFKSHHLKTNGGASVENVDISHLNTLNISTWTLILGEYFILQKLSKPYPILPTTLKSKSRGATFLGEQMGLRMVGPTCCWAGRWVCVTTALIWKAMSNPVSFSTSAWSECQIPM